MNAHVGQRRDGFENEMGYFGLGKRNGGEELLRICQENDWKIVNTWFKKRREHLITYKSGDLESQIDHVPYVEAEWNYEGKELQSNTR